MTKTIRVEAPVNAAIADVYAAYTDPAQVTQWLAEHAAIDLTSGRYAFWGPSVLGAPEDDRHMSLAGAIENSQLQLNWTLLDDETSATLTFQEQEDGTLVTIEHSGLTDDEGAWTAATFWGTQVHNLRAWVERDTAEPRFDFRTLGPGDIAVSVEIDADTSEVFRALIEPEMVERWMHSDNVTIEPEIGGDYDIGWDEDGPVKIVDLDPDRRLAYSWRSESVGHETLVTWELAESSGKTRLTLVHSGFAPDDRNDSYRYGWHGFLVQIKYLVETGDEGPPVHWAVEESETAGAGS